MFRCQLCLALFLYSFGCRSQKDAPYLPAEWDKQQAVFINYSGDSDDAVTTEKVHVVCRDIIRELAAFTQVYVLINEEFKPDSLRQLFEAKKIQTKNIYFLPVYRLFSMGVPRDYGPMVVKKRNGANKIMRFGWDYVGADFINPDTSWARRRELIRDRYFVQMKELLKIEVESSPFVLEGGEIEVNGKGTAMLVDSFHLPRNPHLSKKQQEALLTSSLGVKKTIWLREGPAEDPGVGRKSKIIDQVYGNGVGGHVDEFARFVNGKTIFLAMPSEAESLADPIKKITYDRMKINEDILKKSGDQDGRPFEIVYIPVPDVIPETHRIDTTNFEFPVSALRRDFPEWKHGDSIQFMPAISYLNFLIFNQLVLIPKYWRPGFSERCKEKDEEVRKIFATYFPKKKIVQIDTWGINLVGGGIHCWTQQVPAN